MYTDSQLPGGLAIALALDQSGKLRRNRSRVRPPPPHSAASVNVALRDAVAQKYSVAEIKTRACATPPSAQRALRKWHCALQNAGSRRYAPTPNRSQAIWHSARRFNRDAQSAGVSDLVDYCGACSYGDSGKPGIDTAVARRGAAPVRNRPASAAVRAGDARPFGRCAIRSCERSVSTTGCFQITRRGVPK